MSRRIVVSISALAVAATALVAAPAAQAADVNCPAAAGSYAGGTGSAGDPFLISTPAQLQRLRDTPADWNDAVKLTTDIDMGGCTWATTIGDPMISAWDGTFDGAGHIVSGLDISVTSVYAGFIAYLGSGGTIKDFGFTGDVTVNVTDVGSASPAVGGLVGWTMPSSILRSFATGDVTVVATATPSGGNADSFPYVGGLVGNLQATLSDSYATGDVSLTVTVTASGSGSAIIDTRVGGLTGSMEAGASVVNRSYSTGTVTVTSSATGGASQSVTDTIGGSVGVFASAFATATATVWDTTSSGLSGGIGSGTSANITGKTSSEMTSLATFTGLNWNIAAGFDASKVWNLCPALNGGKPVLSAFASDATCYFPPRTPALSSAVSTEGGFTVEVTNYDGAWTWTPSVTDGTVTLGTPSGSRLPVTVSGLAPGARSTLTLTTARADYGNGTATAIGRALPPPPVPPTAPREVAATPGDRSASVAWQAPTSQGSFAVTTYLVQSQPGGRTCLAPSSDLACTVSGLSNGIEYTFTVRALNGAGWSPSSAPSNAVTPEAAPRPSVLISGSREGKRIVISGQTTGFGMGGTLRPWTRFPGQSTFSEGAATILVSADGTFEWGRKTGKRVSVYVQTPDGSVRSNTVTIKALARASRAGGS